MLQALAKGESDPEALAKMAHEHVRVHESGFARIMQFALKYYF
jgi:hypothetical protein